MHSNTKSSILRRADQQVMRAAATTQTGFSLCENVFKSNEQCTILDESMSNWRLYLHKLFEFRLEMSVTSTQLATINRVTTTAHTIGLDTQHR